MDLQNAQCNLSVVWHTLRSFAGEQGRIEILGNNRMFRGRSNMLHGCSTRTEFLMEELNTI